MVSLRSLSCSDALAPHRFPRHEILQLLVSRSTGNLDTGSHISGNRCGPNRSMQHAETG